MFDLFISNNKNFHHKDHIIIVTSPCEQIRNLSNLGKKWF